MVLLSTSSSRSSGRSSKEEREAFQKGGVLPEQALSVLQQLQQHPDKPPPLPPLPPNPPHPPSQQSQTSKEWGRERPSTQVLESISSMRTDATPNLQGMLQGTPPRSSSGTHTPTQGLMFRRLRSSASSLDHPQQQLSDAGPFPSRTCSNVSCPSNLVSASHLVVKTTPTHSSPQILLEPPSSEPPPSSQARPCSPQTLLEPPSSEPPPSSQARPRSPQTLLDPPSSKPPPSSQAHHPCSTSHLPPHSLLPPSAPPLSAPIVPASTAATSPPKNLPLAALRGTAADAQGPGSKESVGRARRLPKILVPPAALGLSMHPSLCGSMPEWQPDLEAEGQEGGDGWVPDTAACTRHHPLWEPPSHAEILHCVKHNLKPPDASRSAGQLLLALRQSPPSPNSCHRALNTWSMGVHRSSAASELTHLGSMLTGDAPPSPVRVRSSDSLVAPPFPEDGDSASQCLEQGCQEATNLNPSVRGGLNRAVRAQALQQEQQQQQQQQQEPQQEPQQQAGSCDTALPSSPAVDGKATRSSPQGSSRMGLDIRRSLAGSKQPQNSFHRLRQSAWSLGLAVLYPKMNGRSMHRQREEAKDDPLLSTLGPQQVGCEPSSFCDDTEGYAAGSGVAEEHAALAALVGVRGGMGGGSGDGSASSSLSSPGEGHTGNLHLSTSGVGPPQKQAPGCIDSQHGDEQSRSQLQQRSQRDNAPGRTRSGRVKAESEQHKSQQGRGDVHGCGRGEDEVEVLYPLCLADSSSEVGRIGGDSSEGGADSSSVMGESIAGSGSQLWRAPGRSWLDGFSGCLGKALSPQAVPPSPTSPLHALSKAAAVPSSTNVTNPLAAAAFFPVQPKASVTDTAYDGGMVSRGNMEQHHTLLGAQPAPDKSSHHHSRHGSDTKRTDCSGRGMQLPGECDNEEYQQHLLRYLDRAARCSSSLNAPASEPSSQGSVLSFYHQTSLGQKKGDRAKEGLLSWLGQSLRRSRRIKPACA